MPIDRWRAQAAETYGTALITGFLKKKKRKLPETPAFAKRYKLEPPAPKVAVTPTTPPVRSSPRKRQTVAEEGGGALASTPNVLGVEETEKTISAGALLQLRREGLANDPWAQHPDTDELEDDSWLQEALGSTRYPLRNRRGRAEPHSPVKWFSLWLDPLGDIPGFDNEDEWYERVPVDVSQLEGGGAKPEGALEKEKIEKESTSKPERTREESPDRTETRGESQWESRVRSTSETVSGLPRTWQGPPAPEEGAGGELVTRQRLSTPATEGRSQAGDEQTSPAKETALVDEMEEEFPREGQAQAEPDGEDPGGGDELEEEAARGSDPKGEDLDGDEAMARGEPAGEGRGKVPPAQPGAHEQVQRDAGPSAGGAPPPPLVPARHRRRLTIAMMLCKSLKAAKHRRRGHLTADLLEDQLAYVEAHWPVSIQFEWGVPEAPGPYPPECEQDPHFSHPESHTSRYMYRRLGCEPLPEWEVYYPPGHVPEGLRVHPPPPPPPPPAQMAVAFKGAASYLELVEPTARALLAQEMKGLLAFRRDRRLERVKAPVIRTEERRVWVNGKPLTGTSILDTGAMPLLIGKKGMKQLGWGKEDIIPDGVTLGLADGKSLEPFPLTREPVEFVFNKGTSAETSIRARAVVTQAPYDFLVGNVVLWSMGMVINAWREQVRYRVGWRQGRERAGEAEGYFPVDYERNVGMGTLSPAF
ncbi:hypothetical protein KFL_010470040 [Klebsormidium nitens]|uniref:Uncharacterized protein n=1 Tax=Klebsormidium nitens TaxID=105231 RepID=A0A1Y1IR75_KLENI|nr:hypothetical protein KFL_010470040 [Klebsormidium nitens]|eukprot:GAQ92552.1 hypothetical protein KFL_010470040 [Klebsormidium nitens]